VRLWSVHPRYLDRQGLTACWREALLAQAVRAGTTRGYTRHPQLERFRQQPDPLAAVGRYLDGVAAEAQTRGYRFDRTRIRRPEGDPAHITVTSGQLAYEWEHLRAKLERRSPEVWATWRTLPAPEPHPLFEVVDGPVSDWERPGPR
jgi:hypothetical protein